MTERPDLFGACVPEVGVMDMLRFHLYTVGAGWIREFGDPENPADAARLRSISPLHRLREHVDYPPTLVVTADQDDRVVPGPHSYQFFHRLQQIAPSPGDHLLRVQLDAGHAAGRSVTALSEERGDILCFLSSHILTHPLALAASTPEGVSA
jgi:prolyl oligopeptidase